MDSVSNIKFRLQNSAFTNCTTTLHGGVVSFIGESCSIIYNKIYSTKCKCGPSKFGIFSYVELKTVSQSNSLTSSHVSLFNNGNSLGGMAEFFHDHANDQISDNNHSYCTAVRHSSILLRFDYATCVISFCTFYKNVADNEVDLIGFHDQKTNVYSCNIQNNSQVSNDYGCIGTWENGILNITSCIISEYGNGTTFYTNSGGIIYIFSSIVADVSGVSDIRTSSIQTQKFELSLTHISFDQKLLTICHCQSMKYNSAYASKCYFKLMIAVILIIE